MYATFSCCSLLFIVLFVPETKGKDLEEMDQKFSQLMAMNR